MPHEKSLEFFKVYTKANCEHECHARATLAYCTCVQFYQVRNQTTRICGISDIDCYEKADENFDPKPCKCFDPCDTIKYEVEMNIERIIFEDYRRVDITVKFRAESFYVSVKKKHFTKVEILSFVGGLLGGLSIK